MICIRWWSSSSPCIDYMVFRYESSDSTNSMLDLPIKLVDSIFLEEDWDHGYVLFICIIGVIHSRCEDSRLPLLKVSLCLDLIFKATNNCKIPCHPQHTSAHCHQSEWWYSPECLSSYNSWEKILTRYSIVWPRGMFFCPFTQSLESWHDKIPALRTFNELACSGWRQMFPRWVG